MRLFWVHFEDGSAIKAFSAAEAARLAALPGVKFVKHDEALKELFTDAMKNVVRANHNRGLGLPV
jgi:hypothetical protein